MGAHLLNPYYSLSFFNFAPTNSGSLLRKGLGISTGAGEKAFEEAYKAGKTGNKAFIENIKGNVPIHDVLDVANKDLNKIGQDLSAKYRSGMVDISNDKAVLSFDNINQAIADAKAVREVALANAKAALEEALTPKLHSMLNAKLNEIAEEEEDELEENYSYEEEEEMETRSTKKVAGTNFDNLDREYLAQQFFALNK